MHYVVGIDTRLKAQAFRLTVKILQLTDRTTTRTRSGHARTVSRRARIPCLGEVT